MGPMDLPVMPAVSPMLAKSVTSIPDGASYEPKWDGFRSICFRDGAEVELGSRNERPLTRYFPELVAAAMAELPERCVVDGEIVIATATGLDFEALQLRLHPADSRVRMLAEKTPAAFIAFDLLALGDDDYTGRPFSERRAALVDALAGCGPSIHVTPATTERATAQRWFSEFEGAGLDGVIAKPLSGTYQPDKRVMFKIKHVRTADCVVAGYRLHKSGDDAIGSLLLGLYSDDGTLASVGVIGAFPMATRRAAVHRVAAARHHVRRPPMELGGARGAATRFNAKRGIAVERGQEPVVRAAASRTRRRSPVRPHGGSSVFATPHSSTAGGRTAIRARAPTPSWTSRSPSRWATSCPGSGVRSSSGRWIRRRA